MTRMSLAPASLALAIALGACGSSGSNAPNAAPSGGVVNAQLPVQQTPPQKSKAKPAAQPEPAKAPKAHPSRPKKVYGVTYKGAKPNVLPNTEKLAGDAKKQALDGSIRRFVAWGNAFYGTTVLDNSVYNACTDKGPDVWSCAITIKVIKPFAGHKAGPIAGGYTVTLDPKSRQLTYASGLS
jgi:hypothetical protein